MAVVVTRDLFRLCVGKRVTWRKFFIAGVIMTMCGMVLPALIYPLNSWLLSQPIVASSYNSLNSSVRLSGVQNGARLKQTQSVPAASVVSISPSSIRTAQSELAEKRQAARRRRRRKHSRMMPKILSPPPPPPLPRRFIPARLQVNLLDNVFNATARPAILIL